MNRRHGFLLVTMVFMTPLFGCRPSGEFPTLRGDYLGQVPPGMTPQAFAPGIVSTNAHEGCSSFSKDGSLYLFARAGSAQDGILLMQQIDGVWSTPALAPFSAGQYDWDFMLAPDDKTVFVSSGRPIVEGAEPETEYRIWISKRSQERWSEPRLLPYPVNTGQHDSYPSVTETGTLYFFSNRDGGIGEGDIYVSKKTGDEYVEVENFGSPINTVYHEVDPFIAPDESYLIFCSDKPGGYGDSDMYVSFRQESGGWRDPVNLGDKVNTPSAEYIPYISPDSKYFFFTSNHSRSRNIYWVDARIVFDLQN